MFYGYSQSCGYPFLLRENVLTLRVYCETILLVPKRIRTRERVGTVSENKVIRFALIGVDKNGRETVSHPGYRTLAIAKEMAHKHMKAPHNIYVKYIIRQVTFDNIPPWEY